MKPGYTWAKYTLVQVYLPYLVYCPPLFYRNLVQVVLYNIVVPITLFCNVKMLLGDSSTYIYIIQIEECIFLALG